MSSFSFSPALPWFTRTSLRSNTSDLHALQLLSFVTALQAVGFQLLASLLSDAPAILNLWIPIALGGTCIWGVAVLMHTNSLWMWSPLVTALAAIAVFHGLGPLLHVFGDPGAIAYANQFASINDEELTRTNLLNIWSLACILAAFTLFFRARERQWNFSPPTVKRLGGSATRLIGWIVICVALPLKYFVVLPYFLGWTDPDFVLPGFVVVLGNFSLLALFLLLYYAWSRSPIFYIPAGILLAFELTAGLLSFNKTEIVSALGVAFLGLYFVRPSRLLAVTAITVIASAYLVITPIVSRGRIYIGGNPASISDRIEALQLAWDADKSENPGPSTQGWWTRLCYANAQAFCLRRYDAGMPGDTFGLILPAVVPRMLWPDKPIMTPGFEFNQLVTHNRRSSSAPGVFAEAYWNSGWPAVLFTCAYLGLLFNWFTRVAFRYVAARDVRWLPFGVGGLLMGASVTDWFASTYVGGALTYVAYFFLLNALMPQHVEAQSL